MVIMVTHIYMILWSFYTIPNLIKSFISPKQNVFIQANVLVSGEDGYHGNPYFHDHMIILYYP